MAGFKLDFKYIKFSESFSEDKLAIIDQAWVRYLTEHAPNLKPDLATWRDPNFHPDPATVSGYLITVAPLFANFVADLFGVKAKLDAVRCQLDGFAPRTWFKEEIVSKQVRRHRGVNTNLEASIIAVGSLLGQDSFTELELATYLHANQEVMTNPDKRNLVLDFCKNIIELHRGITPANLDSCESKGNSGARLDLATTDVEVIRRVTQAWTWVASPSRLDFSNLVATKAEDLPTFNQQQGPDSEYPPLLKAPSIEGRHGFDLLDGGGDRGAIQQESAYCIYCHTKENDFCRKGFPAKDAQSSHDFKLNPLDDELAGCPLDEKVSEMNWLRRHGMPLAALAVAMVDNPLVVATGHRICNDCMKSCIYQKQEPVNIPEIESANVREVLDLPWGVEIYDFMVRYNPLRRREFCIQASPEGIDFNSSLDFDRTNIQLLGGRRVAIMGMGPAGFTLAHHLTMQGYEVVGFDGLKIEPLPMADIHQPIYRFADIEVNLSKRLVSGFGGVAEYGITSRWNKNYLTLIYLSLMRRQNFALCGGVRFGSSFEVEDAWKLGFDHLALAIGAGLPRELRIPGAMAPGMRHANDFLMSIHLSDLRSIESLTSFDLELPAVVIGGGLTAVDTATEVQAYYLVQIQRVAERYWELCGGRDGNQQFDSQFAAADLRVIKRFCRQYAFYQRAMRLLARFYGGDAKVLAYLNAGEDGGLGPGSPFDIEGFTDARRRLNAKIIERWGGVTIVYRRHMADSPAYQRNYEELNLALQQGVRFAQGLQPEAVILDDNGHIAKLRLAQRVVTAGVWNKVGEVVVGARCLLVATGTQPNIAYEYENSGTFTRAGDYYASYSAAQDRLLPQQLQNCKDPHQAFLTSYELDNKRVSFIGDSHPAFHGSVVKAMASGMRASQTIARVLAEGRGREPVSETAAQFHSRISDLFQARVTGRQRLSAELVLLRVHAPFAVQKYQDGQFVRLQNYVNNIGAASFVADGGVGVALAKGEAVLSKVSLSAEPVALTPFRCHREDGWFEFIIWERGVSSKILSEVSVGSAISLMGPTGAASRLKDDGALVVFADRLGLIASYLQVKNALAKGNRVIVAAAIDVDSSGDEVLVNYYRELGCELYCWGKDRKTVKAGIARLAGKLQDESGLQLRVSGLPAWVREVRTLTALFNWHQSSAWHGSVYGPMQCMLKGICAQCLQWQVDPQTGMRTKAVYSCSWQDQPLALVDWDHANARSAHNSVHDKLNRYYLDHVLGG